MDRRQQPVPVAYERRHGDRRENHNLRSLIREIAEGDLKIAELLQKGEETLHKARQFQEQLRRALPSDCSVPPVE